MEKAIHHLEVDLRIATPFNWHDHLCVVHTQLAWLFLGEDRLDDAQAHIERAKSHTVDSPYNLGGAMVSQAAVWNKQRRFEEARSEVLRAVELFEKLGAASDVEACRQFLQFVEEG